MPKLLPPAVAPRAEALLIDRLTGEASRWRAGVLKARALPERPLTFVYDGPAGFVLEHGAWFPPDVYPIDRYPQGAPQLCYANSLAFAMAGEELEYVEGFAVAAGGLIVQHAWNVTAEGGLLDSTWLNTGHAYFGVRFSADRADDCTWNGDATVLDDWRRLWPLLQHRWEGEPGLLLGEPSEAARARLNGMHVAVTVAIVRARSEHREGPYLVTHPDRSA